MKKMNRKTKKGFTLVELVVVIAIIAILGAVSVVGYFAFIDKANFSADSTVTTQINTALKANEAIDGKPATLTEAKAVMAENGIIFEDLKASSKGFRYAWDSKNNNVVLLNDKQEVVAPEKVKVDNKSDLFVVIATHEEKENLSDFSHYLKNGYQPKYNYNNTKLIDTDVFKAVNGVDVGENRDIQIEYSDTVAETVSFRTNETKITIDNSNANVYHYGSASDVVINNVAKNSYHEKGSVKGTLKIANGHLVAEKGSLIHTVEVQNKNVTLDFNNDTKDTLFLLSNNVTEEDVKLPTSKAIVITKTNDDIAYLSSNNKCYTDADINNGFTDAVTLGGTFYLFKNATVFGLQDINGNIVDQTLRECFFLKKSLVVELNNYELSIKANKGIYSSLANANLTFKNGIIYPTSNNPIFASTLASNSNVTLDGITTSTSNATHLFNIGGKATLNVLHNSHIIHHNESGYIPVVYKDEAIINVHGEVTSDGWYAISGNGSDPTQLATLNLYDGCKVSAKLHNSNDDGAAIYIPMNGTFNMYGGVVSGPIGIAIKSGNVNISGGKIIGTAKYIKFIHSGSGINSNGDALQVDACNYPGGNPAHIDVKNVELITSDPSSKKFGYYYSADSAKPEVNFGYMQPTTETY